MTVRYCLQPVLPVPLGVLYLRRRFLSSRRASNSATRRRSFSISVSFPPNRPFTMFRGDRAAERTSLKPLCTDSCTLMVRVEGGLQIPLLNSCRLGRKP